MFDEKTHTNLASHPSVEDRQGMPTLRRYYLWLQGSLAQVSAIIDQVLVSGGNFLTIAVGANLLPIEEQGKLGYVLAGYLGTVVLGMTSIFQSASVQAPVQVDKAAYRRNLASFQIALALLSSFAMALLISILGSRSGWAVSDTQVMLLSAFLGIQQLADFDRRSAYIFASPSRAATSSLFVYPLRILLLISLRPSDISQVLVWLSLASLAPAILTLLRGVRGFTGSRDTLAFIGAQSFGARWLIASGPVMWLWGYIPTFALGLVLGLEAVGGFVTIRSISNIANVAMEVLETDVASKLGRLNADESVDYRKHLSKLRAVGLLLWLVVLTLLHSLGEKILKSAFGAEYSQFADVLTILWISRGVVFLFRVNAIGLRTTGKSVAVFSGYAAGCIGVALLIFPMLRTLGIRGAALAYVLGAGVVILGQEVAVRCFPCDLRLMRR